MTLPPTRVKRPRALVSPQRRAEYGPRIKKLLEYVPASALACDDPWMQRAFTYLTNHADYLASPAYKQVSERAIARKLRNDQEKGNNHAT